MSFFKSGLNVLKEKKYLEYMSHSSEFCLEEVYDLDIDVHV